MDVESLFVFAPIFGVWVFCVWSFFCHLDLIVLSSFSIILLGTKQLVALLCMRSCYLGCFTAI